MTTRRTRPKKKPKKKTDWSAAGRKAWATRQRNLRKKNKDLDFLRDDAPEETRSDEDDPPIDDRQS